MPPTTISSDHLDGCELDFKAAATTDAEAEQYLASLVPDELGTLALVAASGSGDTGIAARLRAEGLVVREVPGWQTRGRGPLTAKGCVNHHTAGASTGSTPSLRVCIEGRSDLRGPLCNVYLGRDRIVYVVAAGSANHAGLPDHSVCRGMRGNSDAWGLEIEHDGKGPLPKDMVQLAAKVHAALLRGPGLPAAQVVQHHEWSPSRKVDLGTNMHGPSGPAPSADGFRAMVAAELRPPPRWVFQLVDNAGHVLDKSLATGKAGYAARLVAFTGRVAGRMAQLSLQGKGPRIRAQRVQ